jgi:apolipoprotein N-acyltransferase
VQDERRFVLSGSALLSDRSGRIRGGYDKTFPARVRRGFLPFGDRFPVLYEWSPNSGQSLREPRSTLCRSTDISERAHLLPDVVLRSRQMMRKDPADLLVNITNDAWFGDSTEPWIHLALSVPRDRAGATWCVRRTAA